MYILIAIVQNEDVSSLIYSLNNIGISSTKVSSSGGFLKNSNSTLIIAIEKSRIDEAIEVIKHICKKRKKYIPSFLPPDDYAVAHVNNPIEIEVGGASVFVVKLDDFIKL